MSDNKIYGLVKGFVKDNQDDLFLGRLKIEIPGVTPIGMSASGLPWSMPCFHFGGGSTNNNLSYGTYAIPQIGASVWCQFELGDTDKPVWLGTWPGMPDNVSDIPDEVLASNNRSHVTITKTALGHKIIMNDSPEQSSITIQSARGARFYISDANGSESVLISDKDDNRIEISSVDKEIRMTTASGFFWKMNMDTGKITYSSLESEETTGDKTDTIKGNSTTNILGKHSCCVAGASINNVGSDRSSIILGYENKKIANKNFVKNAFNMLIASGSYAIKILRGDYTFETLIGNITQHTKLGTIKLYNLLGKVLVSTAGDVVMQNNFGNVTIDKIGNISVKNNMGKITINPAGMVDINGMMVTISASSIVKLGNGSIPVNDLPVCLLTGSPHNVGNPNVLA